RARFGARDRRARRALSRRSQPPRRKSRRAARHGAVLLAVAHHAPRRRARDRAWSARCVHEPAPLRGDMSGSRSSIMLATLVAVGALVVGQGEASGFDAPGAPGAKPHVQVSADDFARLVKSVDRDEAGLRKRLEELNREALIADARTLARG